MTIANYNHVRVVKYLGSQIVLSVFQFCSVACSQGVEIHPMIILYKMEADFGKQGRYGLLCSYFIQFNNKNHPQTKEK